MTDKNLWVTKQPLEPSIYAFDGSVYAIEVNGETLLFKKALFEELFQRLDVESLTTQLDRIFDELGDYRDVEGYFRAKDRAVAEVLSLLGMKGKE